MDGEGVGRGVMREGGGWTHYYICGEGEEYFICYLCGGRVRSIPVSTSITKLGPLLASSYLLRNTLPLYTIHTSSLQGISCDYIRTSHDMLGTPSLFSHLRVRIESLSSCLQ